MWGGPRFWRRTDHVVKKGVCVDVRVDSVCVDSVCVDVCVDGVLLVLCVLVVDVQTCCRLGAARGRSRADGVMM